MQNTNVIHRLTTVQTFKPVGILVTVNNTMPVLAYPNAKPVIKNGVSQFWFYHRNKAILATRIKGEGYKARF